MGLLALVLPVAFAGEGMWLPEQLPALAGGLQAEGLQIPAAQLANPEAAPLGAIVGLGYCSAAFVSPDGLIATNHHCVSGFLQYLSDAQHNRARDGYAAATRADELWVGPGAELTVIDGITDVTAEVLRGVKPRSSDADRERIVARNQKALVAACEAAPNRRCRVASYFGGRQYRLLSAQRFTDIRMVYAPPESVGSYGGEVDNWMWPRHAGDFALLRAYVGPGGATGEHAPGNVPFRPKHHLTVNPAGVQPGDFVAVAGYPGRTSRYARPSALVYARDVGYPMAIGLADDMLAILHAESAASEEAAGRLAAPIDGIANGRKNNQGMLDGFRAAPVIAQKDAQHAALLAWVKADAARSQRYLAALEELDRLDAEGRAGALPESYVGRLIGAGDLLWVSHLAVRLAGERPKPDLERDAGFQDRDLPRLQRRVERLEKEIWLPADRRLVALVFERILALPADQQPGPIVAFIAKNGGLESALAALYAPGAILDAPARLALLGRSSAELAADPNPWVQLGVAAEAWLAPRRLRDKARAGAYLRLEPLYFEALEAFAGRPLYPDANGTLRVTFGKVEGYAPRDGVVHLPQTTVRGMAAKAGAAPFDAPAALLAAAPAAPSHRFADPRLKDVPVDFLTTLDTTGGNSGSATLDAQGRFVGLLFDGNYESMTSDWLVDPALTRSIHMDVRYMLWVLDTMGMARVVDELLVPAPAR